jgi:hypothetical protein
MVFWVTVAPAMGTNVIIVHLAQRAEWSLTGDKHLFCFLAFSVMVTIAGVTKITTGYPGRTEGAMSQKAAPWDSPQLGPPTLTQTPLRVPPSSTDTLNHGSRRRVGGTYPCPTTQLPDVSLGTRDCSDQRTSPTMSCQAAPHGLLASLSTLPFGR